jgi:hypothetical protein
MAEGYFFGLSGGGAGGFPGVFNEYSVRDVTLTFGRSAFTSSRRVRFVGSGFDE